MKSFLELRSEFMRKNPDKEIPSFIPYYKNKMLKFLGYRHNDDEDYLIEIGQRYQDENYKKAEIVEIDEKSGYIRFFTRVDGYPKFETQPLSMFFEKYYRLCT